MTASLRPDWDIRQKQTALLLGVPLIFGLVTAYGICSVGFCPLSCEGYFFLLWEITAGQQAQKFVLTSLYSLLPGTVGLIYFELIF